MSPSHLTPKQKQFLDYIRGFQAKQGYAPSQQEIARHFGFRSLGTVQNYLKRLEQQGLLQKSWNAKRGLQVAENFSSSLRSLPEAPDPSSVSLPLVGRVAAGFPLEAVEGSDRVEVPRSLVGRGEHFALQVQGDSMVGEGIFSGDTIVVRKQAVARNGQTVVALVGKDATLKRYFQTGKEVELRPANSAYPSLRIDLSQEGLDFEIKGVLVGLIRKFSEGA